MKMSMKIPLIAIIIAFVVSVIQVEAQVPSLLNYQGRVAVSGALFDGVGQFKFSLVNANGAITYWSNGVNSVTCTVTKGMYAVLLGDTNLSNMATLPATVFTNSDVRLRVWFSPEGSALQLLSPDQRVAASGYSLNADQLGGQPGSYYLTATNLTGTVSDARLSTNVALLNAAQTFSKDNHFMSNLGIGTTNAQKRLDIKVTAVADGIRVDGSAPAIQLSTNGTECGTLGLVSSPGQFSTDATAGDMVVRGVVGKLVLQHGAGSSAWCIATNNYVGIHKTNPTSILDVNGTVTASNFSGNGSSLAGVNADEVDGLHAAAFAQLSSSPTFTGTVHAAAFSGSGASVTSVNADELDGQHGAYYLNAANLTGTMQNVTFSTNVALLNTAQAFSQENHFLAKVGVNVTNPQTRLEVRAASNGDGLRVDGSGGVAPAISLSSNGTVCAELALAASGGQYSSDAVGGDIVLRNDISGKVFIQHSSGNSAVCVSTNNYVGIHKVNPGTPLDVNGTVTASNFVGAFSGNGSALSNVSVSTLSVTGKTFAVGRTWGDGPLEVYGSVWTLDQENAHLGYYVSYSTSWQSFTAGTNGQLGAIQAYVYADGNDHWTGVLTLYEGEGTTGTVLSSQSVGGDGVNQLRTFTFETPPVLTESNQYTFCFSHCSGWITTRGASSDTYPHGRNNYATNSDYFFYTYMIETSEVPALVIQPNTLNVGIGVTNPTNKLQVAGHIMCVSVIQTSDRNAKENIQPATSDEILTRLAALPIATWNFKNDSSGPHLGPMAQDFHAAFGLGNTDTGICSVDADGVALAAIQGLNSKLEAELRAKEAAITALNSRLEKLEQKLEEKQRQQAP